MKIGVSLAAANLGARYTVLLNTAGFYDGLEQQFRRLDAEGFLPLPLSELRYFAGDAASAMTYLQERV